ncbi:MAG: deoxynucleoside kinase [Xanthomonadales bacterium]|nr:deoxynucleoside kinase [Xanthomonadales bacterium]
MKRTIGIMGNISAGKTTLCKLIEQRWGFVFYPEEVDELVLNFYYGDRREHAYNTQVFFLSSRFRNWWHMTISPHSGVTDRIKEEDVHIFTEKNYRDTFLSKSEKMILNHQFEAMKHNIPDPDLVIYPHTEVDELKKRIEKRLLKEGRVREGERGLLASDDTYLEDLNTLYEEFYPRYEGNKLRIESNEWKLVNDDGSIRYDSKEADTLLDIIQNALDQNT